MIKQQLDVLEDDVEALKNNGTSGGDGNTGSGTVNCSCSNEIENINALVGTKTNTAEDTVIYRQKQIMENINKLCQVNALMMVVMKSLDSMGNYSTQLNNAGTTLSEVRNAMNELINAWSDE